MADNWQARIHEEAAPRHLVGVDKKRHTFNFFEKKSPLKVQYSYPCVTGQLPGDKERLNDLRTPEGVYFVEYKIASGLDFREYGGIAYTLNYPNPVDRLRGKTGHGIWIHSKGFELVPTRGCVAIDLQNIAEIGPRLTPGTAVVVAEELEPLTGAKSDTPAKMRELMRSWSKAWESRSQDMFKYYDPDAYSIATENFALFRQNKERLFKMLSFIKIYNREIHVLEGPGYWVTWAEQFYTASNLSTEGIRRLYWQKSGDGEFRIVGMEWTPRDVGMRADFQKGRLVAEGPVATASDASSEAPLAPELKMPERGGETEKALPPAVAAAVPENDTFMERVSEGLSRSIASLAQNLVAISDPLIPKKQPRPEMPDEIRWGTGRKMGEPAREQVSPVASPDMSPSTEQAPSALPEAKTTPPAIQATDPKNTVAPVDNPVGQPVRKPLDGEAAKAPTPLEVRDRVEAWHAAYEDRSGDIEKFYDKKEFNRLPVRFGVPKGQSYAANMGIIKKDFAQPWLMLVTRDAQIMDNMPIFHVRCEEMIVGPRASRQGVRDTWWKLDDKGELKIVGEKFTPKALGLEANYLEKVSGDISSMMENWRKAWESANLDEYISYYAPDASQQGRVGKRNIRQQKELLWRRVRPASVNLSGLRLALDGKGIRVDMNQSYSDNSGHADKGVKTMLLRFDGRKWLIQKEDWTDAALGSTLRQPTLRNKSPRGLLKAAAAKENQTG